MFKTIVVTQSDIDTGSITNQATATGEGVEGIVTDLSGDTITDDTPTVTILQEACIDAIALTKTGVFNDVDTSGCSTAGIDTVTYTFTVTNGGNTPLSISKCNRSTTWRLVNGNPIWRYQQQHDTRYYRNVGICSRL